MKVIDWIKKHEYECRDGFCLTWAEDQLGGFAEKVTAFMATRGTSKSST